jgi:hypothetical protein
MDGHAFVAAAYLSVGRRVKREGAGETVGSAAGIGCELDNDIKPLTKRRQLPARYITDPDPDEQKRTGVRDDPLLSILNLVVDNNDTDSLAATVEVIENDRKQKGGRYAVGLPSVLRSKGFNAMYEVVSAGSAIGLQYVLRDGANVQWTHPEHST